MLVEPADQPVVGCRPERPRCRRRRRTPPGPASRADLAHHDHAVERLQLGHVQRAERAVAGLQQLQHRLADGHHRLGRLLLGGAPPAGPPRPPGSARPRWAPGSRGAAAPRPPAGAGRPARRRRSPPDPKRSSASSGSIDSTSHGVTSPKASSSSSSYVVRRVVRARRTPARRRRRRSRPCAALTAARCARAASITCSRAASSSACWSVMVLLIPVPDDQLPRRNRSSTRTPNCSPSTGTRSSMPWNSAAKFRSAGSRSGAKPKQRMPSVAERLGVGAAGEHVRHRPGARVLGPQRRAPSRRPADRRRWSPAPAGAGCTPSRCPGRPPRAAPPGTARVWPGRVRQSIVGAGPAGDDVVLVAGLPAGSGWRCCGSSRR